jgi:hypothetical protein
MVNRQVLRLAWYRLRATFRARRGGYLSIVLLVGLAGGIAMGSVAAARRTQSSYPRFLASTNPSDLTISTSSSGQSNNATGAYTGALANKIARLPGVKHVESSVYLNIAPLAPDGAPRISQVTNLATVASVDGLLFNQDRATVVDGRMADPGRADEVMMNAAAARILGVRVGQTIAMGAYSGAQTALPGFGTPKVRPALRINARLVGIIVLSNQVVQDTVDRYPDFVIFTPALARRLLGDVNTDVYGVQLEHGSRGAGAFEREFARALPPHSFYQFHVTSNVTAKVQSAVKPEAIAAGVFGAIATLAALLIGLQLISRQLGSTGEDLQVLRALGAGPGSVVLDGLIGVLGAVVAGSLLAMAVAVGLSPLAPLGPVRQVYPGRGIAADWTTLGLGLLVLAGGLGAIAVALAYRGAPHRASMRAATSRPRRSRLAAVAWSGLSTAGFVGVRFALEPGRGRTAVPVRSVLLGAVLAVTTVVATLTFGSGLRTLVSHPRLYGWNWSYALSSSNDVPPQTLTFLAHDRDVAASTGVSFAELEIDGKNVPAVTADSRPELSPPILSGHPIDGRGQIVLGAATLAELHKHLGQSVQVSYGSPKDYPIYIPPTRLVIVGEATMPAIGYPSAIQDHPSMGTGAMLARNNAPAAFLRATHYPDPILNGPSVVYVQLRRSVSAAAGLANLQQVAKAADAAFAADRNGAGNTVTVLGVQRPAQIVNYRSMGSTPVLFASGLAAAAILALGLTLTASVRRRRRDLALLKTLGFTQRGLAAALSWQASAVAVIAVVAGVPLGIAAGRYLWTLFAHNINAVPEPTVPVLALALVAAGAILFANAAAAIPGRLASHTPAALVLRTE